MVAYGSHRRYDLLFLDVICKETKWRTHFKPRPFSPRRDTTDDPIIAPLTQCLDCIITNRRRLTVLRMVPHCLDLNSVNTIVHQWTRAAILLSTKAIRSLPTKIVRTATHTCSILAFPRSLARFAANKRINRYVFISYITRHTLKRSLLPLIGNRPRF